jgi:alpha-L-fucosidase
MVAKNGNLLLNVGPDAHGAVTEREALRVRALGEWMDVHAEAVVGTRPWVEAGSGPVRFTQAGGAVYALLVEAPSGAAVRLPGCGPLGERPVELLGHGPVAARAEGDDLVVDWPVPAPVGPVAVLRIGARAG